MYPGATTEVRHVYSTREIQAHHRVLVSVGGPLDNDSVLNARPYEASNATKQDEQRLRQHMVRNSLVEDTPALDETRRPAYYERQLCADLETLRRSRRKVFEVGVCLHESSVRSRFNTLERPARGLPSVPAKQVDNRPASQPQDRISARHLLSVMC